MKRYIPILCLLSVSLSFGCQKKQPSARIVMAEGSLSVENLSNVDIYPVVQAGREESFGVVPTGGGKMVGFAQINPDKGSRVLWGEKKFNAPKRTVAFPLKITQEIAKQTKHLEFLYKGNGVWLLNLYSSSPPSESKPLTSISGEISKEEVR